MAKRNQFNVTLDDDEAKLVNEYCRVNDRTQQWLFKAGARRLIEEDMLERQADLKTLKAWQEVQEGLSEPIDDLLEMIKEDVELGKEMIESSRKKRPA